MEMEVVTAGAVRCAKLQSIVTTNKPDAEDAKGMGKV